MIIWVEITGIPSTMWFCWMANFLGKIVGSKINILDWSDLLMPTRFLIKLMLICNKGNIILTSLMGCLLLKILTRAPNYPWRDISLTIWNFWLSHRSNRTVTTLCLPPVISWWATASFLPSHSAKTLKTTACRSKETGQ